jgi:hypothetical protein
VITAVELALLLRGTERDVNLDAVADLIERGLSAFVIKDGQVVGLENTDTGNARLRAMTLPTAHS